ncbi:glycosyltransferase family protein [Flavilitoribacter nigricans]|uniref:glycosyltransferase family 4 protein n=1 Tax=Flavilitoribacter nigricans TaxID=70997 RepID=UPI00117A6A25|nr:glycosyltransferase family 4 protein [Flavilitoribacter nigricans]
MNIIFLIYSQGKASGGHYHSCNQISKEIRKQNKVSIISLGPNASPVFDGNLAFKEHLFYTKVIDLFKVNYELNEYIKLFKPDIINCFDTESLNIALVLPALFKHKIILTKCGGPNPKRNRWQFADGLLLFSYENFEWFRNNLVYKNIPLSLVSNRVSRLEILNSSQSEERKITDRFNFIRISRLGGAYEKTLEDSFRLIEKLMVKHNVFLYVIGRIQNENRFENLKKIAERKRLPVKFITDERASTASQFLYLGDCVIGTGRSFMEATSLGIPSLTPAENNDIPILVSKNNFNNFFRTNFSERNLADADSLKNNLKNIENLISDSSYYNKISNDTINLFHLHFDAGIVSEKYISFYLKCIESNKFKKIQLIWLNLPYIIRDLFKNLL